MLALRAPNANIHVRIAAERTFLHFAIRDAEFAQEQPQFLQIGDGLLGRTDVRLADDFQERRAGPVEIDFRDLLLVQELAGVFFEMDADQADFALADVEPAAGA